MALTIGIVGLPNVGKSTMFNALTKNNVLAANYPFATIEPNVGVVPLPDPRLKKLAEIFGSAAILPATVSFVDIAGIVKGASEGEGLGNKFLANIREADAICQVVRAFSDDNVIHVDGRVDCQHRVIADAAAAHAPELRARWRTMRSCTSSPRTPTTKRHGCELPAEGARRAASSIVSTCARSTTASSRGSSAVRVVTASAPSTARAGSSICQRCFFASPVSFERISPARPVLRFAVIQASGGRFQPLPRRIR